MKQNEKLDHLNNLVLNTLETRKTDQKAQLISLFISHYYLKIPIADFPFNKSIAMADNPVHEIQIAKELIKELKSYYDIFTSVSLIMNKKAANAGVSASLPNVASSS